MGKLRRPDTKESDNCASRKFLLGSFNHQNSSFFRTEQSPATDASFPLQQPNLARPDC